MKIIVHRGTKQIGGSCIEARNGSDRILLDLGLPLPSGQDDQIDAGQEIGDLLASGVLPSIDGVYANDEPDVLAVVMSHVHQDHIGLGEYVHPTIPVHATEGTWALHDALRPFIPQSGSMAFRSTLVKRKSVTFGSLKVTALPVDHSAPDAVALLVESDGKRILYSGDLRAHGRKAYLYDRLIDDLSGTINVLLLEGTTIGRPNGELATEESLERDLLQLLQHQEHFALIFCSAQNLDRLVTIYRAVKQTRKIMVIDLYTAYTLHKLHCLSGHIPQWDWPEVRVVPWGYQQQRLINAGQSVFVEATKMEHKWIGWDQMKAHKRDVVLLMRSNRKVDDLERQLGDEIRNVQVIWSMWDGYWAQDQYTRPMCEKHGIGRINLHTSGHASWGDLQRFAEGIRPGVIVPIHTEHAYRFAERLSNVRLLSDGEVLVV